LEQQAVFVNSRRLKTHRFEMGGSWTTSHSKPRMREAPIALHLILTPHPKQLGIASDLHVAPAGPRSDQAARLLWNDCGHAGPIVR